MSDQPDTPHPRNVACPWCHAKVGEGCWVWHGEPGASSRHELAGHHLSRRQAAEEAL